MTKKVSETIEFTLGELVAMDPVIGSLAQKPLGISVAYSLSRLIDKLRPELEAFNTKRNELVRSLGNQSKDNEEEFTMTPELNEKLTELVSVIVPIQFVKISPEALDAAKLNTFDFMLIKKLVDTSAFEDSTD